MAPPIAAFRLSVYQSYTFRAGFPRTPTEISSPKKEPDGKIGEYGPDMKKPSPGQGNRILHYKGTDKMPPCSPFRLQVLPVRRHGANTGQASDRCRGDRPGMRLPIRSASGAKCGGPAPARHAPNPARAGACPLSGQDNPHSRSRKTSQKFVFFDYFATFAPSNTTRCLSHESLRFRILLFLLFLLRQKNERDRMELTV